MRRGPDDGFSNHARGWWYGCRLPTVDQCLCYGVNLVAEPSDNFEGFHFEASVWEGEMIVFLHTTKLTIHEIYPTHVEWRVNLDVVLREIIRRASVGTSSQIFDRVMNNPTSSRCTSCCSYIALRDIECATGPKAPGLSWYYTIPSSLADTAESRKSDTIGRLKSQDSGRLSRHA